MAVGTRTRRDCLKLVLAANAAWLGALVAGPWIAGWPTARLSGSVVPIEGLGLSIRFTNLLRSAGVTTIGKLRDLLAVPAQARATDPTLARILRFPPAQEQIRARFGAFATSGPVSFATLTRLETEVSDLVAEGRSAKDICVQLRISRKMLRAQLRNSFGKMRGLCAPYRS
jgi:hypothetical protein